MISNVVNFPQFPDTTQVKVTSDVTAAVTEISAPAAATSKQDDKSDTGQSNSQERESPPAYTLRLTIDKDPDTGEWIYKAIDRYTGKVVSEMPRKGLQDLKDSSSYSAGSFISTEA